MSEKHDNPSQKWLFFFFVCFGLTVLAIGVFAFFTYKVDAPDGAVSGGHGGMLLQQDGDYAPHAMRPWTV